MALTIPASYAALSTSLTRPGEYYRYDALNGIASNYNKLIAEWYPGDLVCHATGGYLSTTYRPYHTWAIGAATEYCYSWMLPLCLDFSTMVIKVTGYATGNDVDVGVGIDATATATQAFTAGAGSSTLTFSVALAGLSSPMVAWVSAAADPAGALFISRIQIYHTPITAFAGGALATSGAVPIDLDRFAEGEPVATIIPHWISRGILGGTQAGAVMNGILKARPGVWAWSDDIQARRADAIISSVSADPVSLRSITFKPRTPTVRVFVNGYGAAGSTMGAYVTNTSSSAYTNPDTSGTFNYITSWNDLSVLETEPNELNEILLQINSDGVNYVAILGFSIYEVWP